MLDDANFGRYISRARKHSETILESELHVQTLAEPERIKAIVGYMKSNYRWDGVSRYSASMDPKEFFTRKSGSSAEINLFLCALLEVAGIKAHPVLTSTHDHGKIKADYPFAQFFNYVLVIADEGTGLILTDATEPFLPYNRIPVRCINEQGLIVKPDSEDWVSLESQVESLEHIAFGMQYELESDLLRVSVKQRTTEYEAYLIRSEQQDTTEIISDLRGRDFLEVRDVVIQNAEEVEKACITSIKGDIPLQRINHEIVITPFLDFPITENLFKQASRLYPMDFIFRKSKEYLCVLDIPEGFVVSEMPAPLLVDDHLVKLQYLAEPVGDKLKLTGTMIFKQAVYDAADYVMLKKRIDTMITRFTELVILKPE